MTGCSTGSNWWTPGVSAGRSRMRPEVCRPTASRRFNRDHGCNGTGGVEKRPDHVPAFSAFSGLWRGADSADDDRGAGPYLSPPALRHRLKRQCSTAGSRQHPSRRQRSPLARCFRFGRRPAIHLVSTLATVRLHIHLPPVSCGRHGRVVRSSAAHGRCCAHARGDMSRWRR